MAWLCVSRRRSAGQEPDCLEGLRSHATLQPQEDCTPLRPAVDESDEEVVSNAPHSGGSAAHTNQGNGCQACVTCIVQPQL